MPDTRTDQAAVPTSSPDPTSKQDEAGRKDSSDKVSEALGSIIAGLVVFGPIFYFIVWRNLPFTTPIKLAVTGGIAAAAGIIYIFLKAKNVRVFEVIGNGIVVVLIVVCVALCSILFTSENQTQLFKLFVVLYFSFLPPWLYLQFITTKGETLWDEYVLNLFRLHIDEYSNLPQPPKRSAYYLGWLQACKEKEVDDKGGFFWRQLFGRKQEKSLYTKKFEGLFGPVPANDASTFARFRGENLWPVAIATILISTGWVLVVKPDALFHLTFMPDGFQPSSIPHIPSDAFRFGFLGAYFYVLQMLVRRYFQNDLKTSAYVNATMRVIIVILLVWTLDLLSGDSAPAQRLALAFAIGVFPHIGWQALQALIKLPMKLVLPSLSQQYPLSDLDGLNIWYESRLLEEGIEDMQNLATANLVDVMLNTRIPVERLVDWVDQSLLYLRVDKGKDNEDTSDRARLRRYGVRTATDLEDVFRGSKMFGNAVTTTEQFIQKFERVLNSDSEEPSVVLSIVATLRREPNLYHVREWKMSVGEALAEPALERPGPRTVIIQPEPVIAPALLETPAVAMASNPPE